MAKHIIKCCHCGAEYLPAEIYLPDAFLGRPRDIEKDLNGKIMNYLGSNMNVNETYTCDYCNRKFSVESSVKFYTDSKTKDFKTTYKSKFSKPNLFMKED